MIRRTLSNTDAYVGKYVKYAKYAQFEKRCKSICIRDANYAECKTIPITIDSKTTLLNQTFQTKAHPVLKRDRLGKHPFAGFGTVMENIKRSGFTKNQPILLGAF